MKQPRDFFENAKRGVVTLYRSKESCNCGACKNDLKLGITPTSDDDVDRLFKEQEKGIEFTITPPIYPAYIYNDAKPKTNSKKIRAMQLTQNKINLI
jgi:hypothetical protein